MTTALTVLVTGATGNQGGAVTRALLGKGHRVRALVRNVESPSARKLAAQGVDLVPGNFDDTESLAGALRDVDSFYLMSSPVEVGVEGETQRGISLANAAKAADVGHLVYSSVASADLDTGIPHFESKFKVEQHIMAIGIPYTISAPAYFMENALAPWSMDVLKTGKIVQAMPNDRALQQISVKNIGDFVAAIIDRRDAVFGKRIDIAGDELTGEECAGILTRISGRKIQYESSPLAALREQSEDLALMYEWFDRVGFSADLEALQSEYSDVPWQRFAEWAETQDWRFLESDGLA
jgi:uncharacterized protein YbjT (DUF2867 family)